MPRLLRLAVGLAGRFPLHHRARSLLEGREVHGGPVPAGRGRRPHPPGPCVKKWGPWTGPAYHGARAGQLGAHPGGDPMIDTLTVQFDRFDLHGFLAAYREFYRRWAGADPDT